MNTQGAGKNIDRSCAVFNDKVAIISSLWRGKPLEVTIRFALCCSPAAQLVMDLAPSRNGSKIRARCIREALGFHIIERPAAQTALSVSFYHESWLQFCSVTCSTRFSFFDPSCLGNEYEQVDLIR